MDDDIIFDSQQILSSAWRTHDLYRNGDAGLPPSILDRNGEVVLSLCKRCGRGEADLAVPCLTAAGHKRAPKA